MQQTTGNTFSDLYVVNKCLIAVLVIIILAVMVDTGSYKRNISRLNAEQENLLKKKEQTVLLENLYHSLEQKQASMSGKLVFFNPAEQAVMNTMAPKDIVRYLAGKNGISVDWIEEVPDPFGPDSQTNRPFAVSLQGDFSSLKGFLLDLSSWPLLRKLPLIQVFAGKDRLDVLVKFNLDASLSESRGGTAHE